MVHSPGEQTPGGSHPSEVMADGSFALLSKGNVWRILFYGMAFVPLAILASVPDHSQEQALAGPGDPIANPGGLTDATCGLTQRAQPAVPSARQVPAAPGRAREGDHSEAAGPQQPMPTLHPRHLPG